MKKRLLVAAAILLAVVALGAVAGAPLVVSLFRGYEHLQAGLTVKRTNISGHRIVYLEGGSGPAVLLVHGYGADKDHWSRLSRHLTERYHVVAPDMPGNGDSTRDPQASYDIETQARRLREFARAVGIRRFHLVGNSMGGNIAGVYALLFPDDVATLTFIDTGGITTPTTSHFERHLAQGVNLLVVSSPDDFDRLMNYGTVKRIEIPGFIKRYLGERAFANKAFNEKIMADHLKRPQPLDARLGGLTMPVLVIWGDQDRIIDVSAVTVLQKGIRDCTTVIMKDCGHVPMLERPDETAGHLVRFIEARR